MREARVCRKCRYELPLEAYSGARGVCDVCLAAPSSPLADEVNADGMYPGGLVRRLERLDAELECSLVDNRGRAARLEAIIPVLARLACPGDRLWNAVLAALVLCCWWAARGARAPRRRRAGQIEAEQQSLHRPSDAFLRRLLVQLYERPVIGMGGTVLGVTMCAPSARARNLGRVHRALDLLRALERNGVEPGDVSLLYEWYVAREREGDVLGIRRARARMVLAMAALPPNMAAFVSID